MTNQIQELVDAIVEARDEARVARSETRDMVKRTDKILGDVGQAFAFLQKRLDVIDELAAAAPTAARQAADQAASGVKHDVERATAVLNAAVTKAEKRLQPSRRILWVIVAVAVSLPLLGGMIGFLLADRIPAECLDQPVKGTDGQIYCRIDP